MGCGASIQPQDTYTFKVAIEGTGRVSSTGKVAEVRKQTWKKKTCQRKV